MSLILNSHNSQLIRIIRQFMQFNVPQFIDIEDKILGPLTLKQFMIFLGVGILILFLWYLFELWFVIIISLPLVIFAAASVFIKINGRSLPSFVFNWVRFLFKPRSYIWQRKEGR